MWKTVYDDLGQWRRACLWEEIKGHLRERVRLAARTPGAAHSRHSGQPNGQDHINLLAEASRRGPSVDLVPRRREESDNLFLEALYDTAQAGL
jgi:hypothetical protein